MLSGLITNSMTDSVLEYDDLADLPTPEINNRHCPVAHKRVVDIVKNELQRLGIPVADEKYIISSPKPMKKDAHNVDPYKSQYDRMFGLIELETKSFGIDSKQWCPTIGIRNSHDRSVAISVVGGAHTMVCSNLQIVGEHEMHRKHTVNMYMDLDPMVVRLIQDVTNGYAPYIEQRAFWQQAALNIDEGDMHIIGAARKGIIPPSKVVEVSDEWHNPNFNYGNKQRCFHDWLESFTATALRPKTVAGLNTNVDRMRDLTAFTNNLCFDAITYRLELITNRRQHKCQHIN